jgi:aldehyde:ferredoxin oxidoreductase
MAERLGSGSGKAMDPPAVDAALLLYYEMRGWDPATGVPRTAKFYELDIGWVAELLG